MSDESTVPARRQTRQRAAVAAALESLDDFRSAQEIHDDLRRSGEGVGLTTVYRALQALAADGLVDVIVRSDGEAVYRRCSSRGHHHHLVCRSCRAAIEVEAPSVEEWASRVAHQHGFTEVSHTVEVFGICPDCTR